MEDYAREIYLGKLLNKAFNTDYLLSCWYHAY